MSEENKKVAIAFYEKVLGISSSFSLYYPHQENNSDL
jgi:uncharacterized glyoxalase superfamily protein PhnB